MKNKNVKTFIWQAVIALFFILSDRMVKGHILSAFRVGDLFGEIPFFADFIYVQNTGAAFSVLSGNTALLGAVSVVFVIAVALYRIIKKLDGFMINLSLALLFAGALGNAIDRIMYGYVVDFIAIKWFNFPVFNIADIAVVAGAIAMILYVLFFDKSEEKNG